MIVVLLLLVTIRIIQPLKTEGTASEENFK